MAPSLSATYRVTVDVPRGGVSWVHRDFGMATLTVARTDSMEQAVRTLRHFVARLDAEVTELEDQLHNANTIGLL